MRKSLNKAPRRPLRGLARSPILLTSAQKSEAKPFDPLKIKKRTPKDPLNPTKPQFYLLLRPVVALTDHPKVLTSVVLRVSVFMVYVFTF
jgi:hypothetical protein